MSNLDAIRVLSDAGCFRQALHDLDQLPATGGDRLGADILRVQLLERTGQYRESVALAEKLLRKPGVSLPDRSTCELTLAKVNIEYGEIDLGVSRLQRSIAIARECEDIERLCWAQLLLLLVLSDRSGSDSVLPLLEELRSRALQTGHPGIVAGLHIYIAETEAKRGLLRTARRHLEMAKRGLAISGNRWLEAHAANVESAIETMFWDFASARDSAQRCLELSDEAGTSNLRESALGNLGYLSYLAGRFDDATAYLTKCNFSRRGSDTWAACIDTLARIHLVEGRLNDCTEALDQIDAVISNPSDRAMYTYRHAQLIRAKLLARQGDTASALDHIGIVIALAIQSGDHLLNDVALLLKCELLLETGQISECVAVLRNLMSSVSYQAPEFYANYERVLACAMARTGHIHAAQSHHSRAERMYLSLQHQVGQLELARAWQSACETRPDTENISPVESGSPATILSGVASLMLHVGRPELIARELIDLLDRTGCVQYAAAVACSADGTADVLAQTGRLLEPGTPREQRLAIGKARDRQIDVVLTAKDDLESLAAINAVVFLLATLRDLDQAHAEREERATLWPTDELPADAGGAVTVGHMRDTIAFAKKIAHANISVLITGESGTGKEVVARAIHTHSSRAQRPFVPFNCAAIPREMLESQLFGHRRGAFTGADRDHAGVIRSARDGTLFLDEIGELSFELQPKLLRFLESGEICPLGESTPFVVDVRIVAATNSNLEGLVKAGRFREDLFYRLNVVRLSLKPLRERRDEIPTLVSHFLMHAAEEFKKHHLRIAEETMERLVLYAWPGNVRQLQNEIRRLVALAEPHTVLRPDVLSPDIVQTTGAGPLAYSATTSSGRQMAIPLADKLNPTLARIEREMIKMALHDHDGRVDAAARALGISRKGLYLKRHRLGL